MRFFGGAAPPPDGAAEAAQARASAEVLAERLQYASGDDRLEFLDEIETLAGTFPLTVGRACLPALMATLEEQTRGRP